MDLHLKYRVRPEPPDTDLRVHTGSVRLCWRYVTIRCFRMRAYTRRVVFTGIMGHGYIPKELEDEEELDDDEAGAGVGGGAATGPTVIDWKSGPKLPTFSKRMT